MSTELPKLKEMKWSSTQNARSEFDRFMSSLKTCTSGLLHKALSRLLQTLTNDDPNDPGKYLGYMGDMVDQG